MLLYFLQGSLPWQGLTTKDHMQKSELILEKKKMISTKNLCKDPKESSTDFDYIWSLKFDETPVYTYLRKILRNLLTREGFE